MFYPSLVCSRGYEDIDLAPVSCATGRVEFWEWCMVVVVLLGMPVSVCGREEEVK